MKSPLILAIMSLLATFIMQTSARGAPPAGTGICRLASVDDVSNALHVAIVRAQMKANRQALGQLQPVTLISGLGDEAFASSQSMMFVRKGDTLLRITYTGCPCTTKDVEPLARRIVGAI
jgi:hypothetical protein